MAGTAVAEEIRKFGALADEWWDVNGPMKPLHQMNPLRTGWIADRIAHAHRRPRRDLGGLSLLDVGCGAGLASEAFARFGATVTGVDAAGKALEAARAHASRSNLAINYQDGTPEGLAARGARFDAVVALEVIEHVNDRRGFLESLVALTKPSGQVFVSTLNRTALSWLTAKMGAEYVLRLLPAGTHDWRMFVTPAELGAGLRQAGMRITDITGLRMALPPANWRLTRDTAVNYLAMAERG
jgi:2-polyprenyl-6-hydroxyphenyl methylase/3-demethylubiquinone-9 3-methyltransferase